MNFATYPLSLGPGRKLPGMRREEFPLVSGGCHSCVETENIFTLGLLIALVFLCFFSIHPTFSHLSIIRLDHHTYVLNQPSKMGVNISGLMVKPKQMGKSREVLLLRGR